ncbi:Mitogen-activated protein kinase [Durusdinium trenchii]|uniref:Mitogen-activated protein kinase n=1 Tax=Durusdinium trenchii TaxID=1381693 RepID=A0ABP0R2H3_9DINO
MACVFAACVILWAEYQDDITLVFEPLREASGSADLERIFAACVILWAEYQDDITLVFEPLREASGSADLERIFQFSKERDSIKLSSIDLPTLRLEAALRKLQMVSVASVAQLAEVLLLPKVAVSVSPKLELDELEEEVLNVKLQEVGCKAFSREALASLRQELDTRDVGAMDALEVTDTEVTETEMGDAGGDLFEQEAIDFVVVFERVALRASMALDGEVVGVLTRGRVLRGVPQQDAGRPWVKVKLQEVNGGPLGVGGLGTVEGSRVQWVPKFGGLRGCLAPGAGLELADTKPKRVKVCQIAAWGFLPPRSMKKVCSTILHWALGDMVDPSDCVLEERPFFRRHGVAQLKGHQKFFTKSFRAKFEQIKAQSHVYASPAMLRSAVSFCSASLMTQQSLGGQLAGWRRFDPLNVGDEDDLGAASSSTELEPSAGARMLRMKRLPARVPRVPRDVAESGRSVRDSVTVPPEPNGSTATGDGVPHPEHRSVALAVAKLCRSAVPCCHEISEEVLQRAILAIEMNIFVGECCFLTFCRMNHSCFPNVVYISEKRQFRALRKIQKGEELLHSYLGFCSPPSFGGASCGAPRPSSATAPAAQQRIDGDEDPMRRVACRSCAHAKEHYEAPAIGARRKKR